MKYIFFLILLILFCKDSDSKENKDKFTFFSVLIKAKTDMDYKNTYCKSINIPNGTPNCIKSQIENILKSKVDSTPAKINSYLYKGDIFYSILCCGYNIPIEVISISCVQLCYRGIGGVYYPNAPNPCGDFFSTATNETLIWEDRRTESGGCK